MAITAIQGVQKKQNNAFKANINAQRVYSRPITLKNDVFIKSTQSPKVSYISFKGNYQKEVAEKYIEQIEQSKVTPLANGWQCEFYKVNDEIGIKAPKPLHPEIPPADFNGHGNVKEHFALKKINAIDPEVAVKIHDIIYRNDKNYLVLDYLKGDHPFKSKLTNEHLEDIMNKSFVLDIHGIASNDLQGGNIILTSKDKTKFIDFGSYCFLTNKGEYLNSDGMPHYNYINGVVENMINSSKEGKFMATYYSKQSPYFLMRSDNPYLKIHSNANNFEYRTIYDYLRLGREENPKEFLSQYLKAKAKNYHGKMIEFLETLNVSQNDKAQFERHKKAIEQEKNFKEVFSNPSENIIKSEIGRIQIKWLINHNEAEYRSYAPKCFRDYKEMIKGFSESAQGSEKKYFEAITKRMGHFEEVFKGANLFSPGLKDEENLLKKIFDNVKTKVENVKTEILETVVSGSLQEAAPKNIKGTAASSNKKVAAVLAFTGLLSAAGVYSYKKYAPAQNRRA